MTGSELITLVRDQEVVNAFLVLKRDFLRAESSFIDLSDDDFISLVLLAPTIGVTLANGSISLYEELSLNKKVRNLSRKSFFASDDPMEPALKFLIKNFIEWENRFYEVLKLTMHSSLKRNQVVLDALKNPESLTGNIQMDFLNAPYIFVKFLSFIFLDDDDDILNKRTINRVELDKIKEVGIFLDIDNVPLFKVFCDSFMVREDIISE